MTPATTTTHSQPKVRLWKDLIRVGRYRHPTRRFTVRVDRPRLDHWAHTFNRMSTNGVRVHIPADHSDAAADNRGYVLALRRVGDRLMALCQLIGADAIRDAARNQVSIGVAPTFIDGHGNVYHDAIVHVALTPVPVVPGQGDFLAAEALPAATRTSSSAAHHVPRVSPALAGAAPAGVLTLAAAHSSNGRVSPPQRRANMAQKLLPCSEENLSTLHDLIPGLCDSPDEQKLEKILQFVQSLIAQGVAQSVASPPEAAEPSAGQADLSLADSTDPQVRQALLDAVRTKRDLCITRGALTPAVADALLARLIPSGDSAVINLSRQGGLPETLALSVFTALAENRPIVPGQRTGAQPPGLTPLARAVPGEAQPAGPPLYEKMAAMANGKCVTL
jgi:hypothetical protein